MLLLLCRARVGARPHSCGGTPSTVRRMARPRRRCRPGPRPDLARMERAARLARCCSPIHRVQVDTGPVFTICDAIRRKPELRAEPGAPERCSARLHILGAGHGLRLVVALSDDEYTYLTGRPNDPTVSYEYVGALATGAWI